MKPCIFAFWFGVLACMSVVVLMALATPRSERCEYKLNQCLEMLDDPHHCVSVVEEALKGLK